MHAEHCAAVGAGPLFILSLDEEAETIDLDALQVFERAGGIARAVAFVQVGEGRARILITFITKRIPPTDQFFAILDPALHAAPGFIGILPPAAGTGPFFLREHAAAQAAVDAAGGDQFRTCGVRSGCDHEYSPGNDHGLGVDGGHPAGLSDSCLPYQAFELIKPGSYRFENQLPSFRVLD